MSINAEPGLAKNITVSDAKDSCSSTDSSRHFACAARARYGVTSSTVAALIVTLIFGQTHRDLLRPGDREIRKHGIIEFGEFLHLVLLLAADQ